MSVVLVGRFSQRLFLTQRLYWIVGSLTKLASTKMPRTTRSKLKASRYNPTDGKTCRKTGQSSETTTSTRTDLLDSADTVSSLISSLETSFTANQNSKNAAQMKQYMRGQFEFYGIKAPELKGIVKEVLGTYPKLTTDQALELLWKAWQQPNREFQIMAIHYASNNISILIGSDLKCCRRFLDTIQKLITNKSWWDSVDMLAINVIGPMVAKHPNDLGLVMDKWVEDKDMWLRRTAILHQLKYKQKTDSQKLFRYCLMRAEEKEFFIQKSIGWALREYGKTNGKDVKQFVTEHKDTLSNLSVREALKHIK
ncbi:uncharacterized protein LOC110467243 [Mizuhopecten yessoensis]|uniref:DNA alkylation repair enzyme n=1 Tax=Mizuhopecten yessoensis TaxID=6573 RepID=A0A210PM69_MIZYE|nr:uncharacterized protein LOC110467243 [Mizuhopecten yessoensis]OWF37592.1 hypothetical protein KP79_PYT10401 [Mizuhopecten yessoensis]